MIKPIKLIEVKSEIGAGTRGASMGVDAIKIAALDFGSNFFKKFKSVEVQNENHLLLEPVVNDYAKRIKGIYTLNDRLANEIKKTLLKEEVPIVLAGDHSSALGTISGIKMAYPNKRVGVIWIDAHADLHTPYTTPSGNMHGMPIACVLGEDNKERLQNKPDDETVEYWEKLKNLGGISPKIYYNDLVYIALRDFEPQEEFLIKKNKVRVFNLQEIRKKAVERVAIESLNYLDHCDIIYVSFDVDSMDSRISSGTGTPVPNGITEKEAGNLIYYIMRSKKIVCFEMVEINPTLDKENLMAENAFEILQKATNQLNNDF
ncbi:MAG: rocF [Bacteroidetes bacterium]|jgi:arginase|nr:rocF [Bacteroidota bacterium]MDF2450790.1 rocF [Bacteroidota bacterium]